MQPGPLDIHDRLASAGMGTTRSCAALHVDSAEIGGRLSEADDLNAAARWLVHRGQQAGMTAPGAFGATGCGSGRDTSIW